MRLLQWIATNRTDEEGFDIFLQAVFAIALAVVATVVLAFLGGLPASAIYGAALLFAIPAVATAIFGD